MTYELPERFPNGLSNAELEKALSGLVAALRDTYGDGVGKWLPELQLALITATLAEQSRRELARARWVAMASLVIAGAALAVAIIASFIA